MAASSSSELSPKGPQVFINFRGGDVRNGFLSFLEPAMEREDINVFVDKRAARGEPLTNLFKKIEESKIALAIFSDNYATSEWCLDELAKIIQCVKEDKLTVISVFYKVSIGSVIGRSGDFGDKYRMLTRAHKLKDPARVQKWKDALMSVGKYFVMESSDATSDNDFVNQIVKEVKKALEAKGGQPKAVKEIQQPEAVQEIQQPEAVQEIQQPEADQRPQAFVQDHQGCLISAGPLKISGSYSGRKWTFVSLSESTNEAANKVAKMRECWYLDVSGTVDTKKLTSGTTYEVVFVVKVEDTMRRWDYPATAQLMVPDKELQERELQFVELVRNEWIDIQAGVFIAEPHKEEIAFYLYQHNSDKKKTGLVVKCAIIRPME